MIIAFAGYAGSGKSTAAAHLVSRHGFREVALADPMKLFCRLVFGFSIEQLYGPSSARNAVDPRWGISPRHALQTLGTEWGRTLHPDIWVRALLEHVRSSPAQHHVVHDVRFRNEIEAIQAFGGVVIRLTRGEPYSQHVSEQELAQLDDDAFDWTIDNDAMSVDEMLAAVDGVVWACLE